MNRKGLVSFPVLTSFVLGFIILVAMLVTGIIIFANLGSVTIAGSSVSSSSSENNDITQTLLITNESNFTLSNVSTSVNSVTTPEETYFTFDAIYDIEVAGSLPQQNTSLINITAFNETIFNGNFTISLWLNTRDNTGSDWVMGTCASLVDSPPCWRLVTASGRLDFQNNNGSVSQNFPDTNVAMLEDTWIHYVITYNSTILRMYENMTIDDDVRNITGGFYNLSSREHLQIGNHQGLSIMTIGEWNGSMDEIRIYNRAISSSEINATFASGRIANASLNSTGLVLWLSGNENGGTNAIDKSVNSWNGTLIGFANVSGSGNTSTLSIADRPTYTTNGVTETLTTTDDYNISLAQFKLENPQWAYSNITIDYNNGTIVTVTNGSGTSAQALAIATNGSLAFGSLATSFIVWFSVLSLVMLIGVIGSAVLIIKKFGTRG